MATLTLTRVLTMAGQGAMPMGADVQCWDTQGPKDAGSRLRPTSVSPTEASSLDYENREIVLALNLEPRSRNHLPICTGPNSLSLPSSQWQVEEVRIVVEP